MALNSGEGAYAIRPRALLTTMFLRLFSSDLFIHGIGGAQYDSLGDLIMSQFFEVTPPRFITATSTHRLPVEGDSFDPQRIRDLKKRLRELRFHPELFLPSGGDDHRKTKAKLLEEIPRQGQRYTWHQKLEAVNRSLGERVTEQVAETEAEIASLEKTRRNSEILRSREYSFLLFPPELVDQLNEGCDRFIQQQD